MQASHDFYSHGCFLADGSTLLASHAAVTKLSEDNVSVLKYATGGPITDMCAVAENNDKVFVASANRPIKLLSTDDLSLEGNYPAYSHVEEIEHPFRLCISADRTHLIGGFKSVIRLWDVTRPGRQTQPLKLSTRNGKEGLRGHVGAIASKDTSVIAAGTYSKSIALIDTRCSTQGLTIPIISFDMQTGGGVNQLVFLDDGFTLVSGHRQDKVMRFWDTRNESQPIAELPRSTSSSQCLKLVKFGGQGVIAGDEFGYISMYLKSGKSELVKVHDSPVTFVSLNPRDTRHVLSASGSRTTAACTKNWRIPEDWGLNDDYQCLQPTLPTSEVDQ